MSEKSDYLPTTKFIGFDPRISVYQIHNFVNKECEKLMLERVLVYYNSQEHYALLTTTNEQLNTKICIHFGVTSVPVGRVNVQSMLWNSTRQYEDAKRMVQEFAEKHPGEVMIVTVIYHLADCTIVTDCVALLDEFCSYYPFESTDNCHVVVKPAFVPHLVECVKGGQIRFKKDPPGFRIHPNLQERSVTLNRLKLKVLATPEAANELIDWLYQRRKYMPSIRVMRKDEMLYPWNPLPGEQILRKNVPKKTGPKNNDPMLNRAMASFTPVYSEAEDGTIIRHGKANWTWDWLPEASGDGKTQATKLTWSSAPVMTPSSK